MASHTGRVPRTCVKAVAFAQKETAYFIGRAEWRGFGFTEANHWRATVTFLSLFMSLILPASADDSAMAVASTGATPADVAESPPTVSRFDYVGDHLDECSDWAIRGMTSWEETPNAETFSIFTNCSILDAKIDAAQDLYNLALSQAEVACEFTVDISFDEMSDASADGDRASAACERAIRRLESRGAELFELKLQWTEDCS